MEKTKRSQRLNLLVMLRKLFWNGKKKFINGFHKLKWTSLKKSLKKQKKSSICSWYTKGNSSYKAWKKQHKKWRNGWNNCYFYSRWKKESFNLNSHNKGNHKNKKTTNSKIEARNFKIVKCWKLKKRFFTRTNIKLRKLFFFMIKFDH